ncbi:MAG: hypothetical protein KAU36_01930 [candidate division Zixibacteria bacterium]|nr:hypothetical protein [candidate division Zixibacteria bacterium]
MASEMDALRMDERQRLCWLKANRATLMLVGICWLGIIAYELLAHREPWFYIIMVPVFAAIRFVSYRYFVRAGRMPQE